MHCWWLAGSGAGCSCISCLAKVRVSSSLRIVVPDGVCGLSVLTPVFLVPSIGDARLLAVLPRGLRDALLSVRNANGDGVAAEDAILDKGVWPAEHGSTHLRGRALSI